MADLTELEQKDTSEARGKFENLIKSESKFAAHFIFWYSWFWAIASTSYFFSVTFIPIAEQGQRFADIILGFLLGTAVATIIGFFYGSSKD
mgnify:FL=1